MLTISNQQLPEVISAVKAGLEVASGSRAQATYYHSKDEQVKAVQSAVAALYAIDKSLPLLLAAMDNTTHFFRQTALIQELKQGSPSGQVKLLPHNQWFDFMQQFAVEQILMKLPVTYALRMFAELGKQGVSNARTRKLWLKWLDGNLSDFFAVKYRNKVNYIMRRMFAGMWTKVVDDATKILQDEVSSGAFSEFTESFKVFNSHYGLAYMFAFIARKEVQEDEVFPVISDYLALFSEQNEAEWWKLAAKVENSVVMGVITSKKNPLFASFYKSGKLKEEIKTKLAKSTAQSDEQVLRATKRNKKLGVSRTVKADNVSAESVYLTAQAGANVDDLKAQKVRKINLPYSSGLILVDASASTEDQKHRQAFMADCLKESLEGFKVVHTPVEHTDLAGPFVTNIDPHFDSVFILTDGYENYPYEGCLNDMVKEARTKGFSTPIIQINSAVSAEMKATGRPLGDEITTLVATSPGHIETQFNKNLLELNPRKWLEEQYKTLLP